MRNFVIGGIVGGFIWYLVDSQPDVAHILLGAIGFSMAVIAAQMLIKNIMQGMSHNGTS